MKRLMKALGMLAAVVLSEAAHARWEVAGFVSGLEPKEGAAAGDAAVLANFENGSVALAYFDPKTHKPIQLEFVLRPSADKDVRLAGPVKISPDGKLLLVPMSAASGNHILRVYSVKSRLLLVQTDSQISELGTYFWKGNCDFSALSVHRSAGKLDESKVSIETFSLDADDVRTLGSICVRPTPAQAAGFWEATEFTKFIYLSSDTGSMDGGWLGEHGIEDFRPAQYPYFWFKSLEKNSGRSAVFIANMKTKKIQPAAEARDFHPDTQGAGAVLLEGDRVVHYEFQANGTFKESVIATGAVRLWRSVNYPKRLFMQMKDTGGAIKFLQLP